MPDESDRHAPPAARVQLRRLPRNAVSRAVAHVIDLLTCACPQAAHSRSGFVVPIHSRTERRVYERMFVEDMFPFGPYRQLVGLAPTVADIGANVGMFALSAADWFPEARIHLVEPIPQLADRAERLAQINGLASLWRVHRAVIGSQPGEAELHCPRTALGASLLPEKVASLGGSRRVLRVPVVRLDDLAAEHCAAGFDIVKLDTEGCEYDAIVSAQAVLARARLVFVRVFPPHSMVAGVDAKLAPLGLRCVGGTAFEQVWVRDQPRTRSTSSSP